MSQTKLLMIGLCVLLAGAYAVGEEPGASYLLNVPYYNQDDSQWSWAASVSMLLRFYGWSRKPWEIAGDLDKAKSSGSVWETTASVESLHTWLEAWYNNGELDAWEVESFGDSEKDALVEKIKDLIRDGGPVMICRLGDCDWPPGLGGGHAIVATGYDDDGLYIHDPSGAFKTGPDGNLVHVKVAFDQFKSLLDEPAWRSAGELQILFAKSLRENAGGYPHGLASLQFRPWDVDKGFFEPNRGIAFVTPYAHESGFARTLTFEWDGLPPHPGYKFVPTDPEWHAGSNPRSTDTMLVWPDVANHTNPTAPLDVRVQVRIVDELGLQWYWDRANPYTLPGCGCETVTAWDPPLQPFRYLPPGFYTVELDLEGKEAGAVRYEHYDSCLFDLEVLDAPTGLWVELLTPMHIDISCAGSYEFSVTNRGSSVDTFALEATHPGAFLKEEVEVRELGPLLPGKSARVTLRICPQDHPGTTAGPVFAFFKSQAYGMETVGSIALWYTVIDRLVGDVNSDCKVNILDMIFVRNLLNQDVNTRDNWRADVNEDGKINILDLIGVRNGINTRCMSEPVW